MKHFEIKSYTYKGQLSDIVIPMFLDYELGTVSVLESPVSIGAQPKKFVFADRDLDYKQGWFDILDGIKFAVEGAFLDIKLEHTFQQQIKDEQIEKILKKAKK